MTTLRTRAIVSLVGAMTATLALGGCVPAAARPTMDAGTSIDGRPLAIRFDNGAREHVHVYLIGDRREWLLGRVESGARATLRIPEASLAGSPGFMQLAVVTGGRMTLQAARDPRATFTIAQPTSAILSQQWTYAQGQLTSLALPGARTAVGRP